MAHKPKNHFLPDAFQKKLSISALDDVNLVRKTAKYRNRYDALQ